MCDQQSLRSDCAYTQSDQSLRLSLEYSMTVKLVTEHHLEFLSFKGGCTGSYESTLVKMPHCWKSHVSAHICSNISNTISLVPTCSRVCMFQASEDVEGQRRHGPRCEKTCLRDFRQREFETFLLSY